MEVQILKFKLTDEESTAILPVLVQAVAGGEVVDMPPPLQQAVPQQNALPPEWIRGIPEPPTPEATAPFIPPPTGRPETVRTLVWDEKLQQFVKQTWLLRCHEAMKLAGDWCARNKVLVACINGGLIGIALLVSAIYFGWADAAYDFLINSPAEVQQEKQPAIAPEAAAPVPALPPMPGDASGKAGIHGEPPPMERGALE